MLNTANLEASHSRPQLMHRVPGRETASRQAVVQQIADMLALLRDELAPLRRLVHAGDVIYHAGDPFRNLYVVNSGFFKLVNLIADGREQVVGLKFRGDWLGFEGIAEGCHACDAIAMDTGEVWTIRYESLIAAAAKQPALLTVLHQAMSRQLSGERESLTAVCTLTADARVADFLRHWAEAQAERGLRSDQIALRMSRAEIGNYLGITLESVSRALSRLAREQVISFVEKGRRDVHIPNVAALAEFVQRSLVPPSATLQ